MWNKISSQKQGNIGMGRALAYFTSKLYTVSIPLNDCQDYDLIVDIEGELKKIQVKTTRRVVRGNYVVTLKSTGGNKRKIYGTVRDSSCEYLFVSTQGGDDYLIPTNILGNSSLTLGSSMSCYKI